LNCYCCMTVVPIPKINREKDKFMEENEIQLIVMPNILSSNAPGKVGIQDKYGTIAEVKKKFLTLNHIQAENSTIRVSISLYNEWFGDFYKKGEPSKQISLKKFIMNRNVIMGNKKIILGDARIFMAKLPFASFSGSGTDSNYMTLGELVNAWESGKLDRQCPNCNNMLKLLNIGYQLGDGAHTAQGYCFSCQRVNQLATESIEQYFKDISDYQTPGQAQKAFTFEEALAVLKYFPVF
jgi:hypothetical protein